VGKAKRMSGAERGFTLIQLMVALVILLILFSIAVPRLTKTFESYQISGAARGIAAQLSLARLRATAGFTQAQLVINTSTQAYQVQYCSTQNTSTGGCTTWTSDVAGNAGTVGTQAYACTPAAWTAQCGTQYLPGPVSFGYGSISTGAGGQTTIGQTSPIIFNSRGITVNSTGGPTTSTNAIYLASKDGQYYAITVSLGGKPTLYMYSGSAWVEM
jgi:prepilin-type N-terminal cleavage/methylation domain-containing protein